MKRRSQYSVIMFFLGFIFVAVLCMLMSANAAQAEDSSFSWIANSEKDLAGYKIHYGSSSRDYVTTVDCGLPDTGEDGRVRYTIKDTPTENTFYAATAYDLGGNESDYSVEVSDDASPAAPGGFMKLTVTTTTVVTVE